MSGKNFIIKKEILDSYSGEKGKKTVAIQFSDVLAYSQFNKKIIIETKGVDHTITEKDDCDNFVKWYEDNNKINQTEQLIKK